MARPCCRCVEQALHATVGRGGLHHIETGVDRGAVAQGDALPPALRLLGDHPHEQERPGAMDAGCGADGDPERDSDPHELDADQLHWVPPTSSR